jgi:hypothetical protein
MKLNGKLRLFNFSSIKLSLGIVSLIKPDGLRSAELGDDEKKR